MARCSRTSRASATGTACGDASRSSQILVAVTWDRSRNKSRSLFGHDVNRSRPRSVVLTMTARWSVGLGSVTTRPSVWESADEPADGSPVQAAEFRDLPRRRRFIMTQADQGQNLGVLGPVATEVPVDEDGETGAEPRQQHRRGDHVVIRPHSASRRAPSPMPGRPPAASLRLFSIVLQSGDSQARRPAIVVAPGLLRPGVVPFVGIPAIPAQPGRVDVRSADIDVGCERNDGNVDVSVVHGEPRELADQKSWRPPGARRSCCSRSSSWCCRGPGQREAGWSPRSWLN